MEKRSSTFYDGSNFKPQKEIMETITLEEFTDEQKTTLAELHESTRQKLERAGVKELMPVQQVVFKLFVNKREIVVK